MVGAGGIMRHDQSWPWHGQNAWLRKAVPEKAVRATPEPDAFASTVGSVVRNLQRSIRDEDLERVRAHVKSELGSDCPRNETDAATMIGMAIGYLLARR